MVSWYCPQATRWSLIRMRKTTWWMSSYYPCRTHKHSALSRYRLLATIFSTCIAAELSAAPTNSSPSSPALQSSLRRTAPDTLIMPPSPPTARITSWSVDGWIWSADETLKENLHWQSNLSKSHLVHHESRINAWNQTRPSTVRGRWLTA
jgi:hypothetical protein